MQVTKSTHRGKMVELKDVRLDLSNKATPDGSSVDEVLKKLEFQREQRLSLVPTFDEDVRAVLRWLKQDEWIKDETNLGRRERLAELLASNESLLESYKESPFISGNAEQKLDKFSNNGQNKEDEDNEEFYTPAKNELIDARKYLIKYSLEQANIRLRAQNELAMESKTKELLLNRRSLHDRTKKFIIGGTQLIEGGAVSQVSVCKTDSVMVAGNWRGQISILNIDSLEIVKRFDSAHWGKIGGLDWHPNGRYFVSGGADNAVKIWDFEQNNCDTMNGHTGRIGRVKFHPCGRYVASASFDMTWILWDIEKQVELLCQEGHAKEVFVIGFQGDGSLIASAGLDSIGIIWDLRSGDPIITLEGHENAIYGLDWSVNGHQLATGSADGTIKIWDLRNTSVTDTILAHSSAVLDVVFEKENSSLLVSGGHDGKINVYSSDDWNKLKCLEGHNGKVMSIDLSGDTCIYSGGKDRTVKQWTLNQT